MYGLKSKTRIIELTIDGEEWYEEQYFDEGANEWKTRPEMTQEEFDEYCRKGIFNKDVNGISKSRFKKSDIDEMRKNLIKDGWEDIGNGCFKQPSGDKNV